MSQWVIRGLRTGIKSTLYPRFEETAAGTSPGLPTAAKLSLEAALSLVARCPTDALELTPTGVDVDFGRCIHCFRCVRGTNSRVNWDRGYECAFAANQDEQGEDGFSAVFRHSLHILVVDAGDCGACLNEVKQLNNPYYNMHRLGFFLTPTPRHADLMLVVGAVTEHMREPLQKAYDAMPGPKRVVAVGACAVSGGIFGRSFMCAGGVAKVLPVDVEVPGNPPPPLAVLHGLLVAVGRKASADSRSVASGSENGSV
jgi:Ni,Fe-hydrogenase III small subunit